MMKLTQEIIDDIIRMYVDNGWRSHVIIKIIKRRYGVKVFGKAIAKIIEGCND